MARPAASKPQPGKAPSKHSRAARRATSPSINTDKSLKNARLPDASKSLGVHHGVGVTKRKAKAKRLSRAQRVRQEQGMARAEAVVEQLAVKLQKSRDRGKVVKSRSMPWEDINDHAGDHVRGRRKWDFPADDQEEEGDWEDEENVAMLETTEPKEEAGIKDERARSGAQETSGDPPSVKKEATEDEVEVW